MNMETNSKPMFNIFYFVQERRQNFKDEEKEIEMNSS